MHFLKLVMATSEDAEPPLIIVEDNKVPIDEEKRNLMDSDAALNEEESSRIIDEGHKDTEDKHIADRPAADSTFDNTIQTTEEIQKDSLSNEDEIIRKGTRCFINKASSIQFYKS